MVLFKSISYNPSYECDYSLTYLALDNPFLFVTRMVSVCALAQVQGGKAQRVTSYVQMMTNEHCAKVQTITIRNRMNCELFEWVADLPNESR